MKYVYWNRGIIKLYEKLEHGNRQAKPAHNKRYTQIALFGQFGLRKTPVGRALCAGTPFVVFFSATFFCARKNTSYFSSSGTKKRRIPRTLCASFLNDCECIDKMNKIL